VDRSKPGERKAGIGLGVTVMQGEICIDRFALQSSSLQQASARRGKRITEIYQFPVVG